MTGKKRLRKRIKSWGELVEVLDARTLSDGGNLRIFKCTGLSKRKGDIIFPYQMQYTSPEHRTYFVTHPEHYDPNDLSGLFYLINSYEQFVDQSEKLSEEYATRAGPVKKERISEKNVERIIRDCAVIESNDAWETDFSQEGRIDAEEDENSGELGESLAYAEKMLAGTI